MGWASITWVGCGGGERLSAARACCAASVEDRITAVRVDLDGILGFCRDWVITSFLFVGDIIDFEVLGVGG